MKRRRNFFKKHHLKRYESRRFQNPYFQKPKKHKRTNWKHILILGVCLTLFVLFFYIPFLRINSVQIIGTEHIAPESISQIVEQELDKQRFLLFPANNRWLINKEKIQEKLYEHFVFDSIDLQIKGRAFNVTVKERVSTLVWQTTERTFYVDLTGTIIREIPESDVELVYNYPIFKDQLNEHIAIGQTVLSETMVQGAINFDYLSEQINIKIKSFRVEDYETGWLAAESEDDYWILFDPNNEIESQVNNLEIVLRESISNPNLVQYIDLRFGDYVYYK